jgi:hypothetical protein
LAYDASLSSSSSSSSSNREIEDEDEDEDEKAQQETGLNGFMPTLFPAILTIRKIAREPRGSTFFALVLSIAFIYYLHQP